MWGEFSRGGPPEGQSRHEPDTHHETPPTHIKLVKVSAIFDQSSNREVERATREDLNALCRQVLRCLCLCRSELWEPEFRRQSKFHDTNPELRVRAQSSLEQCDACFCERSRKKNSMSENVRRVVEKVTSGGKDRSRSRKREGTKQERGRQARTHPTVTGSQICFACTKAPDGWDTGCTCTSSAWNHTSQLSAQDTQDVHRKPNVLARARARARARVMADFGPQTLLTRTPCRAPGSHKIDPNAQIRRSMAATRGHPRDDLQRERKKGSGKRANKFGPLPPFKPPSLRAPHLGLPTASHFFLGLGPTRFVFVLSHVFLSRLSCFVCPECRFFPFVYFCPRHTKPPLELKISCLTQQLGVSHAVLFARRPVISGVNRSRGS